MENTPLNKAHQLERKAETFYRQKKYDECIECHKRVVALFTECYKLTKNPQALESIRLQKEWNERQIRALHLKKAYFESLEKNREREYGYNRRVSNDSMESLETKIFRTIETHDSLICFLGQRNIGEDSTDEVTKIENKHDKEGSPTITGNKRPKDDQTVIEELKELSTQLRESVHGLLLQLDDRNREIEKLKSAVKALEEEKINATMKTECGLKVNTDSSGGTSPYVFSPCSDFSLDVKDFSTLPPLEPIEMPNFNFTKISTPPK